MYQGRKDLLVAFPESPTRPWPLTQWRTVTSFVDEGRNGLDGVGTSIPTLWEAQLLTQDALDNPTTRTGKCTRIRCFERCKGINCINATLFLHKYDCRPGSCFLLVQEVASL